LSSPPGQPPPHGIRPDWAALPTSARSALECWLDARVASATSERSGFSPGVAARVQTADPRRFSVKAGGADPNPDLPTIYRREARIASALPPDAPAPRFLWSYEDEVSGWVMLVFEEVDGAHPRLPWVDEELDRVLAALRGMANSLTPSPVSDVPTAREDFTERMNGWQLLRDAPGSHLDEWSIRHLKALAEAEAQAAAAVQGDSLVHFDIRADNLLLTADGVVFVDWPLAVLGAPWLDLLFFAPSVQMQGGPRPEELLARCDSGEVDADSITAVVVAIAGFFTQHSLLPPPPGLPTVRAFQSAQAVIARRWVAERTGWS
jgi:aminoglycoside phosphotransferase (APT) family kinase protein